jgi:acyl-CoA reductase-like NAD-dependent aldehyde dehydrogenase
MVAESDFAMLIDGALKPGAERFDVENPATEEAFAQAPDCTRAELDAAVLAARNAFPAWSARTIDERRTVLEAMADAIDTHADILARILTLEQGKPIDDAKEEVMIASFWLRGAAALHLPVVVNDVGPERFSETRRVPIGVVGAIAPWNFPLVLAMFKVGPALLSGNTMVLKPSPFTPLTTLKFGEVIKDILPRGVLNIVSGADRLGPWLTEHEGINKVSFTGSTATGKAVMRSASSTLKRVTLELGGNDAAIVLPDVDVDSVAERLFWAAFRNNGQVCIATKRMYVHESIYEPLRDAMLAYAQQVSVGNGTEQGIKLGPINNRPQFERVRDLIADCRTNGYGVIEVDGDVPDKGYFIKPTFIDNPPEHSRIVQEEQFGPVIPLIRYSEIEEVLNRVNDSPYGLGGSVWSSNSEAATDVARRINSGTIWVNDSQFIAPNAAFGGMQSSGVGVEGGEEGLLEYTYPQTLYRTV